MLTRYSLHKLILNYIFLICQIANVIIIILKERVNRVPIEYDGKCMFLHQTFTYVGNDRKSMYIINTIDEYNHTL